MASYTSQKFDTCIIFHPEVIESSHSMLSISCSKLRNISALCSPVLILARLRVFFIHLASFKGCLCLLTIIAFVDLTLATSISKLFTIVHIINC